MSVAATPTFRRDVKILGLVSAGHFVSHFYSLCLPVAPKEHRAVEVR